MPLAYAGSGVSTAQPKDLKGCRTSLEEMDRFSLAIDLVTQELPNQDVRTSVSQSLL